SSPQRRRTPHGSQDSTVQADPTEDERVLPTRPASGGPAQQVLSRPGPVRHPLRERERGVPRRQAEVRGPLRRQNRSVPRQDGGLAGRRADGRTGPGGSSAETEIELVQEVLQELQGGGTVPGKNQTRAGHAAQRPGRSLPNAEIG